jgi:hypothetical protein
MVIVTETPHVIASTRVLANMRSKPHTPRETQLISVHTKMPRKVDNVFVKQPLDLRGGGSNSLGPPKLLGYFGLPMMDLGKPPLPPNRPYQPFNYPKYVKDSNLDVYVKVFKVVI